MISGRNALTCYLIGAEDAPERTCKVCGKTFRAGKQYAYKLWSSAAHKKNDWYCSYTCYRTVAKRNVIEAEERRREYARALYHRQKERKQRQTKVAKERKQKQDETVAQMIARMRRESERRKGRAHEKASTD